MECFETDGGVISATCKAKERIFAEKGVRGSAIAALLATRTRFRRDAEAEKCENNGK
jgi:hypothetical protein